MGHTHTVRLRQLEQLFYSIEINVPNIINSRFYDQARFNLWLREQPLWLVAGRAARFWLVENKHKDPKRLYADRTFLRPYVRTGGQW